MQVSELWRYPVKSMQGERLESATIDELGIQGDRGWALFDTETNLALTARRQPELLFGAAALVDGRPAITLPDGTVGADDAALSAWLGREVQLRPANSGVSGTFETQADENETGDWFQWSGPEGSFHDSGKARVSLVTADHFRDWDQRRFRINVILAGSGDVELVGSQVQVGSVALDVLTRVDRCVMTTRPQPSHGGQPALERDLDVLRTISREDENALGIGCVVITGGTISVGDAVERSGA
jgi:uncharacterized protein YcbX